MKLVKITILLHSDQLHKSPKYPSGTKKVDSGWGHVLLANYISLRPWIGTKPWVSCMVVDTSALNTHTFPISETHLSWAISASQKWSFLAILDRVWSLKTTEWFKVLMQKLEYLQSPTQNSKLTSFYSPCIWRYDLIKLVKSHKIG